MLARLSIVSGTHAIVAALAACTPPGRRRCFRVTGLAVRYTAQRDLRCARRARAPRHRLSGDRARCRRRDRSRRRRVAALAHGGDATVFIQRSRGYAPRPSLSIAQCERAIAAIKRISRLGAVVLVDNCYGELVEEREPLHVGADLIMGSLIKNLGGSLGAGGCLRRGAQPISSNAVAAHLYAPGLRDALGPTLGFGRALCQGLFIAPLIVEQSLRGLDFFAALFENLGYPVDPKPGAARTDIVQAIRLGSPELLQRFAEGLQSAMPLNARFPSGAGKRAGLHRAGTHVVGCVRQRRDDRAFLRRADARAIRRLRSRRRQRRRMHISARSLRPARSKRDVAGFLQTQEAVEVVTAAVRRRYHDARILDGCAA